MIYYNKKEYNFFAREMIQLKYGYIRVSTLEQNEERQRVALKKYDIDNTVVEKVSGKDLNRPQLQYILNNVKEGDSIYVEDFSRLARSTKDLLFIVEELESKGVHLVSLKENIDTSTHTGKLLVTILASIYEFERASLLDRQREGIAIAKEKGVYKGRKKKHQNMEVFVSNYNAYMNRQLTKTRFAELMNVSRATLNKWIYDYEERVLGKKPVKKEKKIKGK